MKGIKLILAVFVLFPLLAFTQPIKLARNAMDQGNYPKAISILKGALGEKEYRNSAIPLLAECYRLQHDNTNELRYYAQAVVLPDAEAMTFLYYGQSLQFTGDYIHARDMYLRYSALKQDGKEKLFLAGCDSVLGPWQVLKPEYEIKTVNNINTYKSDFGPAFADGYLVYASDYVRKNSPGKAEFERTSISYLDIVKSKPLSQGDFWGKMGIPSQFDPKLNQEFHDGPACFSADGNTVYLTRSFQNNPRREKGVNTYSIKLFYATKTNSEWCEPIPFFLNSKEYSIGQPSLSADGQALYFTSDMPGSIGGADIWMCNRVGETWSMPVNLGNVINTVNDEMFPYINSDGSLYFASDGYSGYGGLDIYKSVKVNGRWTNPRNLHAPVNSSYDDFALAFAPGTQNGFFSSNRKGGKGKDDIYAFRLVTIPEVVPVIESQIADATIPEPAQTAIPKLKTDTLVQPKPLAQKPEPIKNQVKTPDPAVPTATEVKTGTQSTTPPSPAVNAATIIPKSTQNMPDPFVAAATEVSKPVQKETQSGSENLYKGKGIYTVQFATGYVSAEVAETIPGAMMHKGSDGVMRYYAGQFSTRAEAKAFLAELLKKGFKDSWISTIDDNRPAKP